MLVRSYTSIVFFAVSVSCTSLYITVVADKSFCFVLCAVASRSLSDSMLFFLYAYTYILSSLLLLADVKSRLRNYKDTANSVVGGVSVADAG